MTVRAGLVRPRERTHAQADTPTASHLSVRDDRDTPLVLRGGTGGNLELICPTAQAGILRQTSTTGNSSMMVMRQLPVVQSDQDSRLALPRR
ncbi:hypothetical protein [Bradyrhizobium sp. STM 3809]|uniref:hypothetical protein n=1 Tax=Bradyrhizobium sp. STM 3809 TaxID=551936 RepID=UPI001112903F|nr:hypothetical protein [Bradyrhizobium sp. STM 3809]